MISADLLTDLLACPVTGGPVYAVGHGEHASLRLSEGRSIPIRQGVARFIENEEFAASFGFQWNEFDVRLREEDEATFVVKTGAALEELKGKRVLDAGCGGGRYSRVAGEHGAMVLGIDRSRAVDKARQLCAHLPNVQFAQADLVVPPIRPASFDLVFSLGVLHHGPEPRRGFAAIARGVKPGGRLSVWMYRRCLGPLEWINNVLRRRAQKMSRDRLLAWCRWGARLGGVPLLNRVLNKVVSFSAHRRWENRVCDTFDWYAPPYQSHHDIGEITEWFAEEGFVDVAELPPAPQGRFYRWGLRQGLLMGSGVNVTGIRRG